MKGIWEGEGRFVMFKKGFFLIGLFLLRLGAFGFSMDADEVGWLVYNRYDGDDAYYKIDMELVDKSGDRVRREMEVYIKDYNGLDKTTIVFLSPPDIRGTAFLSIENPKGADKTQFLYLPSLGRVRRITSKQKANSFVNTDYSYEDIGRRWPAKDFHKLIGEDSILGRPCYVLESVPKKEGESQYSKRICYIDKETGLSLRREFFDKKGRKIREMRVNKISVVDGIPTVIDSEMIDLRTGHKTVMKVKDVRYNQGLPDKVFSVRYMKSLIE